MTDLLRQEIATSASTIVVKVGTRVLTRPDGRLDHNQMADLAEQINQLLEAKRQVVLISSGAVGAGMGRLGLDRRPSDLAQLQAVAAVGQSVLIEAYERLFRTHGRHVAQVLLTAEDLEHRTRNLNARNTILALLQLKAVPVINENDTVAVDELQTTFGDNDRLAAIVTNLIRAPLLVLLSDVDGLYDGHPNDPTSRLIPLVKDLNPAVFDLAKDRGPNEGEGGRGLGKGGMGSKLEAARLVTAAGENVIIASGRAPNVLSRIIAGEQVGTLLLAQGRTLAARKRWIGYTVNPRGSLQLDPGAQRAVQHEGRSLLPIGIRGCEGKFTKGDVVALLDHDGVEFARGLTNYNRDEIQRIQGMKTDQIAEALGHCPHDEVIHRDNMVVITDQ